MNVRVNERIARKIVEGTLGGRDDYGKISLEWHSVLSGWATLVTRAKSTGGKKGQGRRSTQEKKNQSMGSQHVYRHCRRHHQPNLSATDLI